MPDLPRRTSQVRWVGGESLESLRDIERRIQKAEEQSAKNVNLSMHEPAGIPSSYEDHARLMFDMQCSRTRPT